MIKFLKKYGPFYPMDGTKEEIRALFASGETINSMVVKKKKAKNARVQSRVFDSIKFEGPKKPFVKKRKIFVKPVKRAHKSEKSFRKFTKEKDKIYA